MGKDRTLLTLDSDEFTTLIHQSAGLRGRGNFQQAIELVESNLHKLHHDCLENAYLELIYAAREGGLPEVAHRYAKLLAGIDPNIPIVKKVLGENS
jgi:hypothetical protein